MCDPIRMRYRYPYASLGARRSRVGSGSADPPRTRGPSVLACITALTLSATGFAQSISPSSIVSGPSQTCGGGTESHSVCVSLPAGTTSNRVDVFLLLDDTGSFTTVGPQIATVFNGLVSTLQAAYPGVDFSFGVGRFEDYGGPGAFFSGDVPSARPFILNQAIVKPNASTLPLLVAALNQAGPGGGGDSPESAIEALYQVATGVGFDGNCDGDVIDSGPAGALATQTSPGASGDVPAFSSYAGVTSGSLGGVGWRDCSVRLVILASDVAPVSPFPGSTIPPTVTGYGSTEPSSAFAFGLGSTTFRYGFLGNACGASSTIIGAVAPSGAATVPATVTALNSLGIQVIGVGPGAVPTASTVPSVGPSVSMSALARLTGAVDGSGQEMVYNSLTGTIQSQLQSAIGTAINRPLDVTLAPVGLPAGLSANWTPLVHTGVTAGSTVCFNLNLTGSPSFTGGSFTLEARDLASNACLGDIPVTLSCEGCAIVTNSVSCTPTPEGWTGAWTWTFSVTNQFAGTSIDSIDFGTVDVTPSVLAISPPIAPGQSRTFTVQLTNAVPLTTYCLSPRFLQGEAELCQFDQCIDLPQCDCWQPQDVGFGSTGSWWDPQWYATLNGFNLSNFHVHYALISVTSPPGVAPGTQLVVFNPPIPPGGFFSLPAITMDPPLFVDIWDELCVTVSLHDVTMKHCCAHAWCTPVADFFGGDHDADFDNDGIVDATDLSEFLSCWGTSWPPADLDEDGLVGAADLGIVLSQWGPVTPP